jgi:cytochrome c-type biogenesis protein CcmH
MNWLTNARAASRGLLLASLLFASPWVSAVDPEELADPVLQTRYRELSHELRCMQCQNQSIADSPVGLAGDLRREVRNLLLAGKTDDEIRDWMRERYGPFVLFRPEFAPRTAWLWLLPGLMLLGGGVVAWRVLRQRRSMLVSDTDEVEPRP